MYKILSTCKGGGYMYARTDPIHPKANSNGLYPLHRVIVENKLGRSLDRKEDVHHIDGNKDNNTPDNLISISNSQHTRLHHKKVLYISYPCGCCGKVTTIETRLHRLRVKRSRSGYIYCSGVCSGKGGNKYRKLKLSEGVAVR